MAIIVGLILVSIFFFSSATQERRPWEGFVYIDNPDSNTTEHRLPASDEDGLCGIWVDLTATQKTPLPQLEGVSTLLTIDMSFENANFEATKKDHVMKIGHDGVTTEEIHICFSSCPTILDQEEQNIFTLIMTTENIPKDNYVNLRVTSRKSFSYSERCSRTDKETLVKETEIDKEPEIVNKNKGVNENEISVPILTYHFHHVGTLFLVFALIGAVVCGCCRPRSHGSEPELPLPATVAGPRTISSPFHEESRSVGDESSKDCTEKAIEPILMEGRTRIDRENVRSGGKKNKKED